MIGIGLGASASSGGSAASTAIAFNGTSDYAVSASALTLSSFTKGVVAFWAKIPVFDASDSLLVETDTTFNTGVGRFALDPCGSSASGNFEIDSKNTGGFSVDGFARPTAAAWHHYAFQFDWAATPPAITAVYVDNSPVSVSNFGVSGSGPSGAFADDIWYFGSRAGTGLFLGMTLQQFAIWGGQAVSDIGLSAVYAGTPSNALVTPTYYWPLATDGTATNGGINLTLNGTTVVAGH